MFYKTEKDIDTDSYVTTSASDIGQLARLQNKYVTDNGVVTADIGYDALGTVTVEVPTSGVNMNSLHVYNMIWNGLANRNGIVVTDTPVEESGTYNVWYTWDIRDTSNMQIGKLYGQVFTAMPNVEIDVTAQSSEMKAGSFETGLEVPLDVIKFVIEPA